MTNTATVSKFIAELAMHFPPSMRQSDDPRAYSDWLKSVLLALTGYSEPVLRAAANEMINTRTDRRFPLVSEIKKIADKHAAEEYRAAQAKPLTDRHQVSQSPYSDWRRELADDLVMTGMGREAARGGWVLSLHDFCTQHGRLPSGHEIGTCRAGAEDFDAAYDACLRGDGGAIAAGLVKLGASMLDRRERLRQRVLGAS
jgi:hypothetical protein